ncbi:phytanoyl-CoA dioxygenase family protein [Paenibacillus spongiae]|uniref:Phytanoyl-CoA dioxygenase family protein n=1 Tax=Paenibacillus spongiae TaxID=2909671 RepID=A0ABY5S4S8_9BACL|nr:phytanoyl-CoA dioxygenase family protein [Paenibacillus spongiae]UVI28897.1 phytanoyl-CoA dioxygenase family protein [Paenibacillus spongiae]
MNRILSISDVNFYRSHHYLHAKQVIPQHLLDLGRSIISRWVDELINEWAEKGLIDDKLPDLDFQHRLVTLWNAAGRPKYMRSPRRDIVGPDMYSFLANPRLLDLAADLLGTDELSAHGIFNCRLKLPDQKWTDTPWHQDAQYYRDAENVHVVSIWIPLQKVTEHNSCLQVGPDLFTDTLLSGHDDEETGFLGLSKEDAGRLRPISVEMDPGDALCFTQLLPHRALPNRSDAVRWSMDIRYEATPNATLSGKAQGFVARSPIAPDSVEKYHQWERKWGNIPRGSY